MAQDVSTLEYSALQYSPSLYSGHPRPPTMFLNTFLFAGPRKMNTRFRANQIHGPRVRRR